MSHGIVSQAVYSEFKLAAIQRLEQGISIAEVARALEVDPNVLHRWRKEFRQEPGNAFPGHGQRRWSEGRIAELERKIGHFEISISSSPTLMPRGVTCSNAVSKSVRFGTRRPLELGTELSRPGSTPRTETMQVLPTSPIRMATAGCYRSGATAICEVVWKLFLARW